MKRLIVLSIMLLITSVNAKTIRIGVIDTGFDFTSQWTIKPRLCENSSHKDFTGYGINDIDGHGTHVTGLIAKNAKQADYCLVIIKAFHRGDGNELTVYNAVIHAIKQKVNIINISAGGYSPSPIEKSAILRALNANIIIVTAAGNDGINLEKKGYYPAMYDERIIVVGALGLNEKRFEKSNYGKPIDFFETGQNVFSIFPKGKYGHLSGTSQATAVLTGKLVRFLDSYLNLN